MIPINCSELLTSTLIATLILAAFTIPVTSGQLAVYDLNPSWVRIYVGPRAEMGASIYQTSDGGYVAAGTTFYHGRGASDVWVLRLSIDGNIVWQRTFGGINRDEARSIRQTSDGGYIVAGLSRSFGSGGSDFWVLKLDAEGRVQWEKTYGGPSNEYAASIQETDDGYIIAGGTEFFVNSSQGAVYRSAASVLKLDPGGGVIWQETFGELNYGSADSIIQTSDGGYVLAGTFWSTSANRTGYAWVLKLNQNGSILWQKTYDGYIGRDIQQTHDGGFILASGSRHAHMMILKLDSNGSIQWAREYRTASDTDNAYSVRQTGDGGFVVAGTAQNMSHANQGSQAVIMKLDYQGNVHWQRVFANAIALSVLQASDGGYVAVGNTVIPGGGLSSDLLVIRIGQTGNMPDCALSVPEASVSSSAASVNFEMTSVQPSHPSWVARDSFATAEDYQASSQALCPASATSTSTQRAQTLSKVTDTAISPQIPGFPIELIIVGMTVGVAALVIWHRRNKIHQ